MCVRCNSERACSELDMVVAALLIYGPRGRVTEGQDRVRHPLPLPSSALLAIDGLTMAALGGPNASP